MRAVLQLVPSSEGRPGPLETAQQAKSRPPHSSMGSTYQRAGGQWVQCLGWHWELGERASLRNARRVQEGTGLCHRSGAAGQ